MTGSAKHIFVVGIVIIVMMVMAVVGCGETTRTTTPEKPVDETETATKSSSTGVGKAVRCGDLAITVHEWYTSQGDQSGKPEEGKQFIIVDIEIENNGDNTQEMDTRGMTSIKTPDGYKYREAMIFPDPAFPNDKILPGQKGRGLLAFEVPEQIGEMYFNFQPMFGDPVQIRLQ